MRILSDSKPDTVAKNIREIREFRKYTQTYLADKLGISQNAYSKIELAYSKITIERLLDISAVLGVELSILLCFNRKEFLRFLDEEENKLNKK